MTTSPPTGDVQAAINAGQELAKARLELRPGKLGELPAVLVPTDSKLITYEHILEQPIRKRGRFTLLDIASFIRFVNEHKQAGTRIFQKEGRFVAVIDFHLPTPKGSSWTEFRAAFESNYSEQWKLWNSKDGQWQAQRQFAEFIEENASDVVDPSPAAMLEISRTLEAKKDVIFKQSTRLENGDSSIRYEETTQAKAGANGELEVPKNMAINIPMFFGMPPNNIPLRLKFAIDNGRLQLRYEIIRKIELLQWAAKILVERVNKECATTCYAAEEPGEPLPLKV